MTNNVLLLVALTGLALASPAHAQAVGGADTARPVAGDPGMSTMAVVDTPDIRVLATTPSPAPRDACTSTPTPPSMSLRW